MVGFVLTMIYTGMMPGEVSSKYGIPGGGDQFEKDIQAHIDKAEALWKDFVQFMLDHDVDPRDVRGLFTRYYEEFLM